MTLDSCCAAMLLPAPCAVLCCAVLVCAALAWLASARLRELLLPVCLKWIQVLT